MFGLSKKERFKKKQDFNTVYDAGKYVYSNSLKLKAIFYIGERVDDVDVKVAFAVYKRAGHAAWRNRVKRLMKEAYRMNKKELFTEDFGKTLYVVFSLNRINQKRFPKIYLKEVMPDVLDLMKKIRTEL